MTTRQASGKKFNSHPLIFVSLQDVYTYEDSEKNYM